MPTGPVQENFSTISATVFATDSGVDGCGVGTRMRSSASTPSSTSTGQPLMPDPPISTPKPRGAPIPDPFLLDSGRGVLTLTAVCCDGTVGLAYEHDVEA